MRRPFIGLTGMRHLRTSQLPGLPLQGVALADDYVHGVERAGGVPVAIPYVENEETLGAVAERLDGLLLTGGEDPDPNLYGEEPIRGLGLVQQERDTLEFALIHMMRAQGKPIFGICRGMQVLNVALGGTLYQDLACQWKGQMAHNQRASRDHLSHRVKIEEGSRLAACFDGKTTIQVNSFHHQAVKDVAPPLRAVAWDAEGLVEAVESKTGSWTLAVQWHPENLWRRDQTVIGLFKSLVAAACNE